MIEISELLTNPTLVNELTVDELFSTDNTVRTEINKLRNEYSNKNNLIPKNIIDQYNSYMKLLDVIFKKLVEVDEQDKPVTNDNYQGQHSAPTNESGSPIWNVCLNGIYPDDFYVRTREYIYMDSDHKGLQYVLSYRNKPNRQIRIFRAVPKSVEKPIISAGDWVTVDRSYAIQHGRENLNNDYKIVQKLVYARDVFTSGDSLSEWGYDPQPSVDRKKRI